MTLSLIWAYLTDVAKDCNTTIIITTHYIEEARQANAVGLMRGGRLLAEAAPDRLIEEFNVGTLEDVFLHLCVRDRQTEEDALILSHTRTRLESGDSSLLNALEDNTPEVVATNNPHDDVPLIEIQDGSANKMKRCHRCRLPSFWAFYALVVKNMIKMRRNIPFLLFQFLLPAIQIILFSVCIGHDPQNLSFGVLNEDKSFFGGMVANKIDTKVFSLRNYTNFSTAYDDVKSLKIWGFVEMRPQFTNALITRFSNQSAVNNKTADEGSLHLYLDMTNEQVALIMQSKMMSAFTDAADQILDQIHISRAMIALPIKVEEPVYGTLEPTFTDFMAPGVIATIICFMATGLTALSFVMERKEGLLDRTYVAGVGSVEIFMAHIFTQFLVMMVQDAVLLIFSLVVFKAPCRGSLFLLIILTLCLGFYGMALGFLISAACRDENAAIQMALGTVYPNLLLSGVIWPIEGMPPWLATLSTYLPMTTPINAMRSVMLRGLGLDQLSVGLGFVASISWSAFLLLATFLVLRIKGT